MMTLALCALLCGLVLIYVLFPALQTRTGNRAALMTAFAVAVMALGLYLWAGTP